MIIHEVQLLIAGIGSFAVAALAMGLRKDSTCRLCLWVAAAGLSFYGLSCLSLFAIVNWGAA